MIRTGELIQESNDKGPTRLVRVAYDGDEKDAQLVDFGGVVSAPIKGAQMLIIPSDGDEGKLYAIALAPPADRVDGNKPGENRVKNLKTGALIEQNEDGTMTISSPGTITLSAPTIVLAGDIQLGEAGASRELALVDTVTSDGATNVSNLATKVTAV